MCEFRSLYFDKDNYVIQCMQCKCFQLMFGNTLLSLESDDYGILCSIVGNRLSCADAEMPQDGKCISLPTPSPGVYMVVSRRELQQLAAILEEADNERRAVEMMKLFEK